MSDTDEDFTDDQCPCCIGMDEDYEEDEEETFEEILADQIPDVGEGVKFPNVKVQLSGMDGNAYVIMGACKVAMRQAKVPNYTEEWERYRIEATSNDYDHLLQTTMRWFDVE